jgi:hypothetical protein
VLPDALFLVSVLPDALFLVSELQFWVLGQVGNGSDLKSPFLVQGASFSVVPVSPRCLQSPLRGAVGTLAPPRRSVVLHGRILPFPSRLPGEVRFGGPTTQLVLHSFLWYSNTACKRKSAWVTPHENIFQL